MISLAAEYLPKLIDIPIDINPRCATPSQWTASGYVVPMDRGARRLVVEPGFFALNLALNIAAAYHPHRDVTP